MSRPTRSNRASGPIGKLQPPFIAVSMSSAVAVPFSSSRTALLVREEGVDGKAGLVLTCTGFRRRPARTRSPRDRLVRRGERADDLDQGHGRRRVEKCTPQTRSGRSVATAMSTTGRVEVLVARMAESLTTESSSANSGFLTARSRRRFDDQVAVDQGAEVVRGGDPCPDLVCGGLLELAALDLAGQRLLEGRHHGVGRLLLAGRSTTSKAGLGRHFGDARPHDAQAQDPPRSIVAAGDATERSPGVPKPCPVPGTVVVMTGTLALVGGAEVDRAAPSTGAGGGGDRGAGPAVSPGLREPSAAVDRAGVVRPLGRGGVGARRVPGAGRSSQARPRGAAGADGLRRRRLAPPPLGAQGHPLFDALVGVKRRATNRRVRRGGVGAVEPHGRQPRRGFHRRARPDPRP